MPPPTAGGRGRGRGAASKAPSQPDTSSARYERISLLAVELQQAATGGDGADSTLFSSDEEDDDRPRKKKQPATDEESEEVRCCTLHSNPGLQKRGARPDRLLLVEPREAGVLRGRG